MSLTLQLRQIDIETQPSLNRALQPFIDALVARTSVIGATHDGDPCQNPTDAPSCRTVLEYYFPIAGRRNHHTLEGTREATPNDGGRS